MSSLNVVTKILFTIPDTNEDLPCTGIPSLIIPETFSNLSKFEPILHSETTDLETSTPLIIWITCSPFWKSPLILVKDKTNLDVNFDDTVLSKWNAPPFLAIETLCGIPIVSLSG